MAGAQPVTQEHVAWGLRTDIPDGWEAAHRLNSELERAGNGGHEKQRIKRRNHRSLCMRQEVMVRVLGCWPDRRQHENQLTAEEMSGSGHCLQRTASWCQELVLLLFQQGKAIRNRKETLHNKCMAQHHSVNTGVGSDTW